MSLKSLERLDVWRRAKDFVILVYREVLPHLPSEEKWGMNRQIRRAAQSIPANIAEGHGRYYYQENVRFCYVARGSLETISFLSLAFELEYLLQKLFNQLIEESDNLSKLINGYVAYLKRSKQGAEEPGASVNVWETVGNYDFFPQDED